MHDWTEILKKKNKESLSVHELTLVIIGLQSLMKSKDLAGLEAIYSSFNEETSSYALVCVLRSTFAFKDQTPGWQKLLDKSFYWLKKRGESPEFVLKGLF